MDHRIIEDETDIDEGLAALRQACPHMDRAAELAGTPPLRRRTDAFAGLARTIVGQQLSVASASAIWGRLEALVDPFEASRLMPHSDKALRGVGLSAGKVATLRGLAEAVETGALDLDRLASCPDGEVHSALVALKGVGPWTADIYVMFCLGRADAFAPGDLALKVAVQDLMGLEARPDEAELIEIAERWRPWRAVAARLLWAYYSERRNPSSGIPV
jgi:DNA-3-methyladenine glycosylase II